MAARDHIEYWQNMAGKDDAGVEIDAAKLRRRIAWAKMISRWRKRHTVSCHAPHTYIPSVREYSARALSDIIMED